MSEIDTVGIPRPVRVEFPVQVVFEGEAFQIEEFTANLSVGGIFLPTDHRMPPRTRGTLTFRSSHREPPFTVQAEVVRLEPPGETPTGRPAGLGIMFVDLGEQDKQRLRRLVEGIRAGTVSEQIRRDIRTAGGSLAQELRRRSTDQKLIFALAACGEEINAVIRDGQSAVVLRLLDNPRLNSSHVLSILRDPRTPTPTLLALKKASKWLIDEELVALFCAHPNAPLDALPALLRRLPKARLLVMERDASLRPQVRNLARQLAGERPASSYLSSGGMRKT